jgi:beta-lactamase regulating signal transducer with metallopeptidase domain
MLGFASLMLPRFHFVQPWLNVDSEKLLAINSAQGIIGRAIVFVWAGGAAVSILKLIAREILIRRTLRRCRKLDDAAVRQLLSSMIKGAAINPLPTILISDDDYGPGCWQLHRPTILLPSFILKGPEEDLRHVLIHECEHLKTNHPLHLFLQHLAQIVCWFHPAVWTASCHASLAREYLCDDAAADDGNRAAAYLRTLLRIAEKRCDNSNLNDIGFSRSRSEIVLRAHRLAHNALRQFPDTRHGLFRKKSAIFCTIFVVTCLMSQTWLPFDSMSSSRSRWSPWPTWTARAGQIFGLKLRDYEEFDRRTRPYELRAEHGAI